MAIPLVGAKLLVLRLVHLQIFLTFIVTAAQLAVARLAWVIEHVMFVPLMVILKKPMKLPKLILYPQPLIFLKKLV
ncbi:MAG TPA: hypothetical protein P5052_02215 [Candidatus Paceibacterota bacterium]|nr:hypothetical protein [Candidatus Paceibacterota bacterium]HRZ29564.1 hypothetical protein [Candidatus Paceibacterota bacterium]